LELSLPACSSACQQGSAAAGAQQVCYRPIVQLHPELCLG
jgi:hypothetical protein